MKSICLLLSAFSVATGSLPAAAGAADDLWVQPMLYVFRNADVRQVAVDGTPVARDAAMRIVGPTSTIRFDDATLALAGGGFAWSPGGAPPAAVSVVASPTMRVRIGQTATVRCAPETQYMERRADGTFALREVAADAADAPRFVLTILTERDPGVPDGLRVTCRTDIVTVRDREAVPGVDLEVGRPKTSSFSNESRFTTRGGDWSALLCLRPTASDYGVLTLLRVADRRPETTMELRAAAKITEAGAQAARSFGGRPVGYLLHGGGFSWLGGAEAGVREPGAAEMEVALAAALQEENYRPSSADLPPAVVLILQWGCIFAQVGGPVGERSHISISPPRAFVIISAYDYADLVRRQETLLWRTALINDHGDPSRVLPALAATSGPFLGRNFDGWRRDSAEIRPPPARTPGSAAPPAPGELAASIADTIDALTGQEQQDILKSGLIPMKLEDRKPHTPIPPQK